MGEEAIFNGHGGVQGISYTKWINVFLEKTRNSFIVGKELASFFYYYLNYSKDFKTSCPKEWSRLYNHCNNFISTLILYSVIDTK